MEVFPYLFGCSFLLSLLRTSVTLETLTPNQSIRDGQTLISPGRTFELGFFSPGGSQRRYVGIWYMISSGTAVWVANRENPLNDDSGVLTVDGDGVLVLLSGTNTTVWYTNISRTAENPVVKLLDTGNLVVKDGKIDDQEGFIWQSFDHPCDTFLPEMKLGQNLVTGLEWVISSWKTTEDPAQGQFSIRLDVRGLPQMVLMRGDSIMARAGSWNGLRFTGYPQLRPNQLYNYQFVFNKDEIYFEYKLLNRLIFTRYVLNPSGAGQRLFWVDKTHSWEVFSSAMSDQCENYALCGAYASCNIGDSPVCACMQGFLPKSPEHWDSSDWSDGCVRRTPLECDNSDGFQKHTGLKLPDTSSSWFNKTMSLEECKGLCLKNCSCTAYSVLDVRGAGSGCLLWYGSLLDIRQFTSDGQELYLRMASSELDNLEKKGHSSKKKQVGIIVGATLLVVGMTAVGLISYKWKRKRSYQGMTKRSQRRDSEAEMELPIFDLTTITSATDNFSDANKLGEGGFGPVYKGILPEGREIAVKRLSRNSGQGPNELKNEVILIAKLQHRNLVKLLGCCIQGKENLLIYEYMPNRSLDSFIFDQTKSKVLDWHKRMNIIRGVAKGLLYLHEDSRLRIIHRDLKASNILLDKNMDPKISDFGLARSFVGNQVDLKTHKIVGTYGYMSPEYAVHGYYSIKSDVFSFGVLILEIVSGKKNREFSSPGGHHNLLGHAWKLWIEDRAMELIDGSVGDLCETDIIRHLHVGLLCVQQRPEDRPDMSFVVQMLSSKSLLPKPRQPGFFTDSSEADPSSSKPATCSANEVSITLFEGR